MQCGFKKCNDIAVKVWVYIPFFGLVYTECRLHSPFTFLGPLSGMRSRSKSCWWKMKYWALIEIRKKSGSTEPWLGHLPNVNNSMKSWYCSTFLLKSYMIMSTSYLSGDFKDCKIPFSFIVVIVHLCLSHVVKLFCVTGLPFGVGWGGGVLAIEHQWAVDSGGVMLGWMCVQSWLIVVMGGFHGHWLSFACCCVICTFLLLLLGGHGHSLGSGCHSWMAGIVWAGGVGRTLQGGKVVVRWIQEVVGWCVEVVDSAVGVVLVGWRNKDDFAMFNTHVGSTDLQSLVWLYFKQQLPLTAHHPNLSILIHQIPRTFWCKIWSDICLDVIGPLI